MFLHHFTYILITISYLLKSAQFGDFQLDFLLTVELAAGWVGPKLVRCRVAVHHLQPRELSKRRKKTYRQVASNLFRTFFIKSSFFEWKFCIGKQLISQITIILQGKLHGKRKI